MIDTAKKIEATTLAAMMLDLGQAARDAVRALGASTGAVRDTAIRRAATLIGERADAILAANALDYAEAEAAGRSGAMLDRLKLDRARLDGIATGLRAVAALPDPLGQVDRQWTPPNGLAIERVRVPLGVIGIIFESRPNVTVDAGALCLKAGNASILRGGSECVRSNRALHACLADATAESGLPATAVQFVPDQDRAAVGELLGGLGGLVDVVVPRGGRSLVERVQREARVPVIGHLDGLCHVYLHAACDADMGRAIALNAKMRRTGICGAAETLLVDAARCSDLVPLLVADLQAAGCEVRGDGAVCAVASDVVPATETDWQTEYLDAVVAIRVVANFDEALQHIATYGSSHTDAIVTADAAIATAFLERVDSAIVLHNASTQFADGGEFGMGAEIGIATGRIHARGPVGAAELTSYKYRVRGSGQIRD